MAPTQDGDDLPVRSFMEAGNIRWRTVKPNFSITDKNYMENRTKSHKPGSLEKTVENLVKTFEMEASHKMDPKEWGTIVPDVFKLIVNGESAFDVHQLIELGSYKCLLDQSPLFDRAETQESSHELFKTAFPTGFAWELLEVLSGPPVVAFSWRHWAYFTGPYRDAKPSGELIEMFGMGVATVNDSLEMTKLEIYNDSNPLLMKLAGGKCPVMSSSKSKTADCCLL